MNIAIAVLKGNVQDLGETIKAWNETKVVSHDTNKYGVCHNYRETVTREELEVTKPNWFGDVELIRGSLRERAVEHLRKFHGVTARKHPVFQGQYAAGLPMTNREDMVERYLVFSYSKAGQSDNNGEQIAPDFDGLDKFYDFVNTIPGAKIIAAHRFAALVYLDEEVNTEAISIIGSWCRKYGGGGMYSQPLVD